jgi:hypothetical protein
VPAHPTESAVAGSFVKDKDPSQVVTGSEEMRNPYRRVLKGLKS